MILSGYNKFIFSIFSENKDYLILTVFALKVGKSYLSFLQIQYTKTDSSGKPMPSFVYNTRLKVIDNSERDIIFSKGKIIFKDDAVKVEFASELVMLYLNYTWDQAETSPLKVLGKDNVSLAWNSFDFRSFVKGNLITPNTSAEFINAAGNIDLVKSKKIPSGVKGLLWSRLHNNDIDLAYSFIFNKEKKTDSKMFLLHEKKLFVFSDIDYHASKEKKSPRLSVKYPNSIQLSAKNETHHVSININNQSEASISELVNNFDFIGKLFNNFFKRISGNHNALRLQAQADVIITNNLTRTEFNGITSISEYVSFVK
jgi:hypothetical protein